MHQLCNKNNHTLIAIINRTSYEMMFINGLTDRTMQTTVIALFFDVDLVFFPLEIEVYYNITEYHD